MQDSSKMVECRTLSGYQQGHTNHNHKVSLRPWMTRPHKASHGCCKQILHHSRKKEQFTSTTQQKKGTLHKYYTVSVVQSWAQPSCNSQTQSAVSPCRQILWPGATLTGLPLEAIRNCTSSFRSCSNISNAAAATYQAHSE